MRTQRALFQVQPVVFQKKRRELRKVNDVLHEVLLQLQRSYVLTVLGARVVASDDELLVRGLLGVQDFLVFEQDDVLSVLYDDDESKLRRPLQSPNDDAQVSIAKSSQVVPDQ